MLDLETGVTFHSMRGAVQESLHIYIRNGLLPAFERFSDTINILEVGFGTGLNALLTLREAHRLRRNVCYRAIEKFPLDDALISALAKYYPADADEKSSFQFMHAHYPESFGVSPAYFQFEKSIADICLFEPIPDHYHLIFFDAFAPDVVPHLWTAEVFGRLYASLHNNGMLLTFSVKGEVRRTLSEVGFVVNKLPGPPGKREITFATRSHQKP